MPKTVEEKIVDSMIESKLKDAHFVQFARDLVSNLKEKQQKVVLKRFGLSGRKKTTLDAIGKEFGVTRERIRQIEAASLNKLKKLAKLEHNKHILEKIRGIIDANGGVIDEKTLVHKLIVDLDKNREEEVKKIVKFIILLDDEVNTIDETDHLNPGWSLADYKRDLIEDVAKAYAEILETREEVLADEILLEEILKHKVFDKNKEKLNDKFLSSSIDMVKKLHKTDDGKRGLTSWPWVKPKTIRDKIFFVLSKNGSPMHFTEIFDEIKKASFDTKSATLQTIHNELISDSRFVLVGRGLYGLSGWGFEAGTVEEVIEKILKSNAPASQDEIVEEVMKKKKVKKATILINLQNSSKFKKTSEGYVLAQ